MSIHVHLEWRYYGRKAMHFAALLVAVTLVKGEASFECSEEFNPLITVKNAATYITSPGFPRPYPNSYKCQSSINTDVSEHVLHVEVVRMQLDNWNRSCPDSVTAYNGNGSEVLTRWCGRDTHTLSTSGSSLVLEFSSDETISDLGYAFSVWSAPPMNSACNGTPIIVGEHPVHLSTNGSTACVYTFQAVNDNDVISLSTPGWQTQGRLYSIEVYDGHDTSSPQLISWSHGNKPIPDVTSSRNHMTIVVKPDWQNGHEAKFPNNIVEEPNGWAEPNGWEEPNGCAEPIAGSIRVVAAPIHESCEGVIAREVTSLAAIFPLPTALDTDGELCPLKLISRDVRQTLRIDVIGFFSDDDVVNSLNVTEGATTGETVTMTRKNNTWTYRSIGPVVYIQGNSSQLMGRTVQLRVLTLDPHFNGKVTRLTAVNSSLSSDLSLQNLQSNAYIVYIITADHHDNIVFLEMTSSFNDVIRADCDQVAVEFFDGSPENRDPKKRWCPGSDPGSGFNVTGTATLSFIVYTNEADPNLSISGSYFSMKEGSMCRGWMDDIPAQPGKKGYIASPNFPGQYSINNDCVWRIAAPRINYVVVAEVTWSDLPDDCSDLVYVVYGIDPKDKTIGRICGEDRLSFRSTGPTLLLHFVSDSRHNRGGFNISYTTEHRSRGKKLTDGPPVGIIAGACIALFIVGGVIYVIVHIYRKRHKKAKRLKEATL